MCIGCWRRLHLLLLPEFLEFGAPFFGGNLETLKVFIPSLDSGFVLSQAEVDILNYGTWSKSYRPEKGGL